ncbi:alpha/beta hydrolase family protein [Clostridium sp.]|uniref:alpha/beta hydrolase family protein n=1 Tax=Clostridium sp. TaxID=1506 RepID=UPI003D6D09BF
MIKKIGLFIKVKYKRNNKRIIANMKSLDKYTSNINLALIITTIIIFAIIGGYVNTGLGKVVDSAILMCIGVIVLLLSMILIKLIFRVLSHLPKKTSVILLSGVILLTIVFEGLLYFELYEAVICAFLIVIVEASMAISIGKLIQKDAKKVKVLFFLFITIVINVYWGIWAFTNVDLSFKKVNEALIVNGVQAIVDNDFTNPLDDSKYTVGSLTYGSGDDKRPEFGKDAKLITGTVNATPMLGEISGLKGKVRELFWGFTEQEYPINGTAWYPKSEGVHPLVIIVHGNHAMEDYSDKGYEYLGKQLASQGFITVSVDENFLNGSWSGNIGNENDVRAWMLLKHLEVFKNWNQNKNNIFYEKVDMENIALIGHSRGGEAVATAAAFNKLDFYPSDADIGFDFNFNIKSVVAIAPTDGQYKPGGKLTPMENINYLVLQGSQDGDVSSFYGDLQYNRVKFTDDNEYFKTSLYILGANHSQFNTTWGNKDLGGPSGLFLNIKPMLEPEKQREIAKIYISAFLQSTLYDQKDYIKLFQNYNYGEKILPETKYISRFENSNYNVIANYEEDIDITTGTLKGAELKGERFVFWREKDTFLRSEEEKNNTGVLLRWENASDIQIEQKYDYPTYKVKLPRDFYEKKLAPNSILNFSLADTGFSENTDNIDLTIQVKDKNGLIAKVALSEISNLKPAIKVKFAKWSFLEKIYDNEIETCLQSYGIPLQKFMEKNPKIDASNIEYIDFIFNKTTDGEVLLDDIGISS